MSGIRRVLTDEVWAQMAEVLQGATRQDGRPAEQRARLVLDALFYRARPGMPGRDLPAECGPGEAVEKRVRRGEKSGGWRQVWEGWQPDRCQAAKQLFMDRPRVRAHPHAAGA